MEELRLGGMGWRRDLPDFRDYTPKEPKVDEVMSKSKALKKAKEELDPKVVLKEWCSPIEDQGQLGSCTANAGAGLYEYFQRRAYGKHLDASRLFLYKVTRSLLGWPGDSGGYLRDTMKAMVLFGIPPERHWPYDVEDFDKEPPSFCYAFAENYKTINYFRHDPPGRSPKRVLDSVKRHLAAGLPSMFGFSVYSSMPGIGEGTGEIPYPQSGDSFQGGHAVVAVGYDDKKKIGEHKGAILIRNSWGTAWGEAGYGWLPFAYVEDGLAVDFWSLVEADFVDTDLFK